MLDSPTGRAPRWAAPLLLLILSSAAQAVPLSYTFDLGIAGSGGFTLRADADGPVVVQHTLSQQLTAFDWSIPGVGSFDLADLALFTLSGWSPVTGLVPSGGRLVMNFTLRSAAQSDTGVTCTTCLLLSTVSWPGETQTALLGIGLARIAATGSPCGSGTLCAPVLPQLALAAPPLRLQDIAAVPEPSSLALAALAALALPFARRRASR